MNTPIVKINISTSERLDIKSLSESIIKIVGCKSSLSSDEYLLLHAYINQLYKIDKRLNKDIKNTLDLPKYNTVKAFNGYEVGYYTNLRSETLSYTSPLLTDDDCTYEGDTDDD